MKKNQPNPNPAGREGKPFSLAPNTFDEALRKILAAKPPAKSESKTEKKPAKKGSRKK